MVPVAGVLMFQSGKVYLAKRVNPNKSMCGYYCDAGGRKEGNETPEETILREAWEEARRRFQQERLIRLGEFEVRNEAEPITVHEYFIDLLPEEVPEVPPEERQNLGPWGLYSVETALGLNLLPAVRMALEEYVRRFVYP